MNLMDAQTLASLWHDFDAREVQLRAIVTERLATRPPPKLDDAIVATYFFALRTMKLEHAVEEIAYHATSGIRHPPAGSLLEACTAKPAGVDAFDATGRLGLLHVAFPLKMMLQPDGHLTSCDVLHTVAAAILFDVYENQDARLIALQVPERVLRTFPGPAHGPVGLRKLTGFAPDQPAFGTILKPTAGLTPGEVEALVAEAARCPLFLFIKEDEDLYPNLDYSPVRERARRAVEAIERAKDARGGLGLIFAPHVSGAPHEIVETVLSVVEAGATGVMFSETFATGAVRMVREATKDLPCPPAIYGHNAGIGVKTRAIWREVIDTLARLDGIDFRQTAPVRPGSPFIRPYGQEWIASEDALSRPLAGKNATMITRAGALDQGNIILNLQDAERRGILPGVLFLAGSAINSIKNAQGRYDPRLGADAGARRAPRRRAARRADRRAFACVDRRRGAAQPRRSSRGVAAAIPGGGGVTTYAKDDGYRPFAHLRSICICALCLPMVGLDARFTRTQCPRTEKAAGMPGQRRIVRVLVVDESMTARKWVAKTLQPDPEITVIAEAGSGQSAVGAIVQRRPDVIVIGRGTLLGSAGALSKALALHRAPIIAVAEPGEDCTGLASLEGVPSGAVQVFERPRASEDRALWHRRFLNAIRAASGVSVVRHVSGAAQTPKPSLHRGGGGEIEIVAIGTSAGGPKTVARLLSALPPLPAPVVLVMHFPGKMFESLLDWLSSVSIMPVAAVAEGSSLDALAGTVSIAVPGRHLIVRRRRFVFDDGPRRHYCKPAVDPLFESIALEYGSRSAAVLLTGMGYDGAEGLLEIRRAGGVTIAQDEATSDVWGMPKAAIDVGAAEHILPDHEIPGFLTGLFQPIRCGT